MLRTIGIVVIVLVILCAGLYGFLQLSGETLPKDHPGQFSPSPDKKTVVFAGDSIFHGRLSADIVEMTREQASTDGWSFVNAGVNGDLSYNLLTRFEDIVACDPDLVIILIGTNDANASFSEENAKRAVRLRDLPRTPSRQWYEKNLSAFLRIIKEQTEAQIAVCTLPPIGEDLDHPINKRIRDFNVTIREVAGEYGATVLPLYEDIAVALAENTRPELKPKGPEKFKSLVNKAAISHLLFGASFDHIGEKNDYLYHSDPLHLDEDGARFASNLVVKLLSGEQTNTPAIF